MSSELTLGGITLHWYGIILAIALLVGIGLIELQARRQRIPTANIETAAVWAIIFGLIGARLYHVATDFPLYQYQFWTALYVWRGGLSIIGAVMGGLVGLLIGYRWRFITIPPMTLMDLAVFGLPVSQAIGRLGNWVNQELYGLPSTLPWAIPIQPEYRLPQFAQTETFHPLFLYEMIATLGFAAWVWWYSRRPGAWKVGSSRYFTIYILYYSIVRFCLDFIRVDKAPLLGEYLGLNQVILIGCMVLAAWWWSRLEKKHA